MVCKTLKGVAKVSGDVQAPVSTLCRELVSGIPWEAALNELSRAGRSARTGSSKYIPIIRCTGGCTGRWVWLNWE